MIARLDTVDVVSDLLGRARAQGAVFALSQLRGAWGLDLDHLDTLTIHVVTRGEAWLEAGEHDAIRLLPGDVAVVRSAGRHRLLAAPGARCSALAELEVHRVGDSDVFEIPGDEPPTELLCGSYTFHGDLCDRLLAQLPPAVHVRTGDGASAGEFRDVIGLIANEVRRDAGGRSTVLDRLLDVLLVLVLRTWFEDPVHAPAWYTALADTEIGRALQLIHARPEEHWTVAALAAEVGLSRAAFARRFTTLVGRAPLTYLTEWRLQLAGHHLLDTQRSIRSIAKSVGYDNEFAFTTAFRRAHGIPPTAYRMAAVAG
jgi:AraC-like DNA-binding protein